MPISLWRDRSRETGTADDLAALKEKYVNDGITVSENLKSDGEVLAAWLSGPFDRMRVAPTSDLHIAVLVKSGRNSFYHHKLPHFSEVGRRLEIAFLPLDYLHSILEKGYSNWTDVFELHKLVDAVVLFERDRVLTGVQRRLGEVRPKQFFVGRHIEGLRRELELMGRYLGEARHAEAVLSARRASVSSLMLLLLIGNGSVPSKLSRLYSELRTGFALSRVRMFEVIHSLAGLSENDAAQLVLDAEKLVRFVFDGRIASDAAGFRPPETS